jgi:hypothetical protein
LPTTSIAVYATSVAAPATFIALLATSIAILATSIAALATFIVVWTMTTASQPCDGDIDYITAVATALLAI